MAVAESTDELCDDNSAAAATDELCDDNAAAADASKHTAHSPLQLSSVTARPSHPPHSTTIPPAYISPLSSASHALQLCAT